MFRWFLNLIRKRQDPDSNYEWVTETADKLTVSIMKMLMVQFRLAECLPSEIPQQKEFYVAAYVAGYCDVMAQGAGAHAGRSLSMTLAMRVMGAIFGNIHGEYMWRKVDEAMHASDATCSAAMIAGGKDANQTFQTAHESFTFGLAEYLGK